MADTAPPPDVLVEFLRSLTRLATEWEEGFRPVLRGSLLLHRWYGARARPPADIDIECFVRPDAPRQFDPNEPSYHAEDSVYGHVEGRFGTWGEYVSRVDLGKAMCRYAAGSSNYQRPGGEIGLRFHGEEDPPAGGADLWVYGTPGQRYFATWEWPRHRPASGCIQIDLSTPGPYTPDDLGVTDESFVAPGKLNFQAPAYSREAMLATKVSWLARGFARRRGGKVSWAGEPKDLFDAHLLACDDGLRGDVFRRAMLAVGAADGLDWNAVDVIFEARQAGVSDALFGNWAGFQHQHPKLAPANPATLWAEIADRLAPLMGDLYPVAELPFLATIHAAPGDQAPLLVYADWLDDRDDPRGPALRAITRTLFAGPGGPGPAPVAVLEGTSEPWLHRLFGTAAKLQAFRDGLRAG